MNRLLFGMILLAVGCLAGSCTDDDEYTQGVWMRRSDLDGVARGQASSFTIGNKGYLCCGYRGSNKTYLKDLWEYNMDGDYWTQCADMPDAAAGRHSACLLYTSLCMLVALGQSVEEIENLFCLPAEQVYMFRKSVCWKMRLEEVKLLGDKLREILEE